MSFANTPEPPYYAVIFSSQRRQSDAGYSQMAEKMETLASQQPGYLGIESSRSADGFGLTVAYFEDEASILAWKNNAEHLEAQELGKQIWYTFYHVRIAKVERAYSSAQGN